MDDFMPLSLAFASDFLSKDLEGMDYMWAK